MKDLFILGAAVPGEASETMVELCLWPSIVLLQYILRTRDPLQKSWHSSFHFIDHKKYENKCLVFAGLLCLMRQLREVVIGYKLEAVR